MPDGKIANSEQLIYARRVQTEDGIRLILCKNDRLSLTVVESRAFDLYDLSYYGNNIAFLSKNGLIPQREGTSFDRRFSGGFLYTCGLENIGRSDVDTTHGSLAFCKTVLTRYEVVFGAKPYISIEGEIRQTALFGENFLLKRNYKIFSDRIELSDEIVNFAFTPQSYMMLYHFNLGYPFLDEGGKIVLNDAPPLIVRSPEDGGREVVQTRRFETNELTASAENARLNTKVDFCFHGEHMRYLTSWQSFVSGDYAFGIEPSTADFAEKSGIVLQPGESAENRATVSLSKID